MISKYDAIFIGGGAASFFAAIRFMELAPSARCVIIEKGKELLQKVKISGGGRCNVTNVISDPLALATHYPRGEKALKGPFTRFSSKDTVNWFESRGVPIKAEEDGRMFPKSNASTSIVECLLYQVKKKGVDIHTRENLLHLSPLSDGAWQIETNASIYQAGLLFLGSGSNPRIWDMLSSMGIKIVSPVPSLFTFNIKDKRLNGLPGISVQKARVSIPKIRLSAEGPLLITHWGLSGPAVLRLSAWGARKLHELNYDFNIHVNWLPDMQDLADLMWAHRELHLKKQMYGSSITGIPARLWEVMVSAAEIPSTQRWADLSKKQVMALEQKIGNAVYEVRGKSTFKEEFVTAGGISLKEIDFKHFALKSIPNLYAAGEVLDIDGITGGFNFQAAWTGAWIAGESMATQFNGQRGN